MSKKRALVEKSEKRVRARRMKTTAKKSDNWRKRGLRSLLLAAFRRTFSITGPFEVFGDFAMVFARLGKLRKPRFGQLAFH